MEKNEINKKIINIINNKYNILIYCLSLLGCFSFFQLGIIDITNKGKFEYMILFSILYLISFLFLYFFIPALKKKNYLIILPVLILYYILFLSSKSILNVDMVSKIFILIFLIFISIKFKIPNYRNVKNTILFIALTLFNTFLFVGHPLFFTSNHFVIGIALLTKYTLFALLLIPIQTVLIDFIMNIKLQNKKCKQTKNYYLKMWLLLFLIMSTIWVIALVGFYPINVTSDGVDQVLQALGINVLSNDHPLIMALFIRLIFKFIKSTFVVGIIQILLFSSIFSSIFIYLLKKGINKYIIIIATVIFTILPNNYMYAVTLYKDVPYTIFLIFISFLIFRVLIEEKNFFSKWYNYLIFPVSIALCCFYRHNGPGPMLFTILFLSIYSFKLKSIKPTVVSILTACLILFVSGPIFSLFHPYSANNGAKISTFNLLIWRATGSILNSNQTISKSSNEIISRTADPQLLKKYFNKYNGDTYGWNDEMNKYKASLAEHKDVSNLDVASVYLNYLLTHPYQTIKERMDSTNILWSVSQPVDGYNHRYADGIWYPAKYDKNADIDIISINLNKDNDSYIQDTFIANKFRWFRDFLTQYTIFDWLLWRVGIWWFLISICSFVLIIKYKKGLYTLFPIIGNTLTYLPTLSWQIYRYVWYVFVFAFLYFFFTVILLNLNKEEVLIEKSKKRQ